MKSIGNIYKSMRGFTVTSYESGKKLYIIKTSVVFIRDETIYRKICFNVSSGNSFEPLVYAYVQEDYEDLKEQLEL